MGTLNALIAELQRTFEEWGAPGANDLAYGARNSALLGVTLFAVVAALVLTWRSVRGRLPGRSVIALPAMLPGVRQSPLAFVRHAPFILFLIGLPFFFMALADPYASLSSQQVSYPGRRIAVLMDSSLSMLSPFAGKQLQTQSDTAFSNSMAAAEFFIRTRIKGRYRDLIALEQFGNEAYVITPFTTDYDNLLLSLRMISDVREWQRFPDQGTIIMKAIDEGVDLFKAFDFLNASGNIMVIFSDGQDDNVKIGDMTLAQVLKKATDNKVPVYLIRMAFSRELNDVIPDKIWKDAIEATGGRFFPAASQETIIQAVRQIDAEATGRVDIREYALKQPRFARFALAAVAMWTLAIALQMTLRMFRTFP